MSGAIEYIEVRQTRYIDGAPKVRENLEQRSFAVPQARRLREMRAKGMTGLCGVALYHTLGKRHLWTFATNAGGFDDAQLAGLLKLLPALALAQRIRVKNRLAPNSVETYVGSHAAELIWPAPPARKRDGRNARPS